MYPKATGASKKPDETKFGLLLNYIGDRCLEIFANFVYVPECDDSAGGKDKLPAENPENFATTITNFDEFFQKRNSQLMLREKCWLHLEREPTQTFDSWIVTIKERAAECKFPRISMSKLIKTNLHFLTRKKLKTETL